MLEIVETTTTQCPVQRLLDEILWLDSHRGYDRREPTQRRVEVADQIPFTLSNVGSPTHHGSHLSIVLTPIDTVATRNAAF